MVYGCTLPPASRREATSLLIAALSAGRYFALLPVFDRHIESYSHSHRTAPAACTVLSAPVGASSVSDTGSCTVLFIVHRALYRIVHRTAPAACTVLRAPVGASSVSDTGSCTVLFIVHRSSHRIVHRTAPSACTVLRAPVGAFSVSDTGSCSDEEQADAGDADDGAEDFARRHFLMEEQCCGGDDEDGGEGEDGLGDAGAGVERGHQ